MRVCPQTPYPPRLPKPSPSWCASRSGRTCIVCPWHTYRVRGGPLAASFTPAPATRPPRTQVTLDTGEKLYRATELNPEVCLRCGRAETCVPHSARGAPATANAPSLKHAARNTTDALVTIPSDAPHT